MLAHLSQSDVAFVQQFCSTLEISLEAGKTLLCFHGSPSSFDEIILPETPDEVVRQFLEGARATGKDPASLPRAVAKSRTAV